MSADLGLAVIDRGSGTTIAAMQSRSVLIRQVMANVLEEGKDYGKIPGTDKPTLYKPGAEKLCLTFALAAVAPIVEDLSTPDTVRYRVNVPIEASDGRVLAVGVGECSSDEEKYRWRRPACEQEFQETPAACRRLKWMRGKEAPYQVQQVRTSPADLANTTLKMAHKRAFVAATLLATGASSVFNQDAEDLAEELREAVLGEPEAPTPPKAVKRASEKPAAAGTLTEALKVRDVRVFGKDQNNYAVTLIGNPYEFTTRDSAIALELEKFKGTDHLVRLAYVVREAGGKTYYNITRIEVADAKVDAPVAGGGAASGDAVAPPLVAGDIPFGR
jgi:hypothetical protein